MRYGLGRLILTRKVLTAVYKVFQFILPYFDRHYNLYLAAKHYIENNTVDWVVTTGEPFILFKYGYSLQKRFNVKWGADFRDKWYHNYITRNDRRLGTRILHRYEWIFEKKYIRNANLITTVDPDIAEKLQKLHKKKIAVIYNGFERFRNKAEQNSPQLILTHSGTLTRGQRVEFLLEALKELDEECRITENDLEIRFVGLEYDRTQCRRILEFSEKVRKYIHTTGRVERDKALELNSISDYLVCFTYLDEVLIHAKFYEYLACRRPVLVIPDDKNLLSQVTRELNAGCVIESKGQLKELILQSIKKKQAGERPLSNVDEQKALFYSREKQAERFVEILKQRHHLLN